MEGWSVHAVCFDPREFLKRRKRRVFVGTDNYGFYILIHLLFNFIKYFKEEKMEEEKWGGNGRSKIPSTSREKRYTVAPAGTGVGGRIYQKPKIRRNDKDTENNENGVGKEYESVGDCSVESLYVFDSSPLDTFDDGSKSKSAKNALLAKLKSKVARRNSYDSSEAEDETYAVGAPLRAPQKGPAPGSLIVGPGPAPSRSRRNRNLPHLARPQQSLSNR
jgi:hypothetical protein